MTRTLARRLHQLAPVDVLVVGDIILDVDVHGTVTRMSPEHDNSPVFDVIRKDERAGGAGAVNAMVRGLGHKSRVIGNCYMSKQRFFVDGHRFGPRIDDWLINEFTIDYAQGFKYSVRDHGKPDIVLISDYGGQVAKPAVVVPIIDWCLANKVPVIADPSKHRKSFSHYYRANYIKCTMAESSAIDHPFSIVTDGANGIHYCGKQYPCKPRTVVDVTGAGDMVLAALGIAIGGGLPVEDAIAIANAAAGLKVERHGAVPVSKSVVILDLLGSKVVPADMAEHIHPDCTFVNGCFDLLGPHHLHLLSKAKEIGNPVVVAVNSDEWIAEHKGAGRPIIRLPDRVAMLSALECVDYVIPFADNAELATILEAIKPKVMVKGADYRSKPIIGSHCCQEIHFVDLVPCSTTERIEQIWKQFAKTANGG